MTDIAQERLSSSSADIELQSKQPALFLPGSDDEDDDMPAAARDYLFDSVRLRDQEDNEDSDGE